MLRSAKSAFTRVFDALWRCAADPGSTASVGPGSAEQRYTLHRVRDTRPSRIVRCVRPAEDVDRVLELHVAPGECRIGVEREVTDREHADPVKDPYRDA